MGRPSEIDDRPLLFGVVTVWQLFRKICSVYWYHRTKRFRFDDCDHNSWIVVEPLAQCQGLFTQDRIVTIEVSRCLDCGQFGLFYRNKQTGAPLQHQWLWTDIRDLKSRVINYKLIGSLLDKFGLTIQQAAEWVPESWGKSSD